MISNTNEHLSSGGIPPWTDSQRLLPKLPRGFVACVYGYDFDRDICRGYELALSYREGVVTITSMYRFVSVGIDTEFYHNKQVLLQTADFTKFESLIQNRKTAAAYPEKVAADTAIEACLREVGAI